MRHQAHGGLLRRPEAHERGTYRQARMQDDLRHLPSRQHDLLEQPRPVRKGGGGQVDGMAFAVGDFHAPGERRDRDRRTEPGRQQERREHAGQQKPEREQRSHERGEAHH